MHAYIDAYIHNIHTYIHTYIHAYIDAYIHNIHTYINTYIRNIHTYIYKGIDGQGTNHSIFVIDSAFIQNNCTGGGGGILIGYNNANLNGVPSLVEVRDCLFDRNIADSSGGALVGQAHNLGSGNYAIFRRCNFTMNIGISEGSALVFGSLFNVQARRKFYASVIDGWYRYI